MRPARFAAGTKSPATPSDYTDAQFAALEKVKCTAPKLRYGAARKEFVNRVMLPDGKISKDLDAVRAAVKKAEAADRTAFDAFVAQHQDAINNEDLDPQMQAQFVNLRTAARHRIAEELEEHLAQRRFLIIVDAELVPRIYFQCYTGTKAGKSINPDVELA